MATKKISLPSRIEYLKKVKPRYLKANKNNLYENELKLYKIFFMPNVKLIDKKRTGKHGEKIKKIYDKAKTPYQRVLECDQINKKNKNKLKEKYRQLNPAELRRFIIAKTDKLNKLKINQPEIVIPAKDKVTFSKF